MKIIKMSNLIRYSDEEKEPTSKAPGMEINSNKLLVQVMKI